MSTKKLSRTVLEGGRHNTWRRRQSTQEERCETRDWLRKVIIDPDYADEVIEPIRTPVRPDFSDVLSPVNRFIESFVGKNWNDARSVIKQKFDMKTLAGWHIVDTHIFGTIYGANKKQGSPANLETGEYLYGKFFIDNDGILRKRIYKNYRKSWYKTKEEWEIIRKSMEETADWLHGRKIGFDDGVLYWYTCHNQKHYITSVETLTYAYKLYWHQKTATHSPDRYKLPSGAWMTEYILWEEPSGYNWNQDVKLDKEEVNYFRSLSKDVRRQILENAPNYKQKKYRRGRYY